MLNDRNDIIKSWIGTLLIIGGSIAMIVCLFMFQMSATALYTAYETALTYTELPSLSDFVSIFGIIIYFVILSLGLCAISIGSIMNTKRGIEGNYLETSGMAIMGGFTIVISLIMFTTIQGQLHDIYLLFS